jgi:caa(3)-type oxidase subunit IV
MDKPDLHVEDHDAHESHDGQYVVVIICLGILTLLELLVTYLPGVKIPLLIILSGTKAFLVVLFFMHLRWEKRLTAVSFAAPVIFGIILALVVQQLVR